MGRREGGGGVDGTPPYSFYVLQYFQTIMHSVESLRSGQKNEVYFCMDGGAAGGL